MQLPFIAWTGKMSVGVAVLDDDHKKLIDLLNDLHNGITAGHGTERLGRVLDGLVEYTGTHFAREEEFFAQTGYPATEEHVQEHRDLTRLVLNIQARYKKGHFDALSAEAMDFLKNWLQGHILGSDMNYKAHLNAAGIH
ncbi:MAG: bacteriohemerythrin [Terracidiphilus sp.]|jgi:hemerythrin-like metal-binding protein